MIHLVKLCDRFPPGATDAVVSASFRSCRLFGSRGPSFLQAFEDKGEVLHYRVSGHPPGNPDKSRHRVDGTGGTGEVSVFFSS